MDSMKAKKSIFQYGPAVISGLLLVLCFPTINLFLIAWIALVPFLISLYDKQPKEAFTAGMAAGISIKLGFTVRSVPVENIQQALRDVGMALHPEELKKTGTGSTRPYPQRLLSALCLELLSFYF